MKKLLYVVLSLMPLGTLQASEIAVTMHALSESGVDNSVGVIVARETPRGLELQSHMRGVQPGTYAFTVNENVGCGSHINLTGGSNVPGMAAGKSIRQLPDITVDQTGSAEQILIAEGMSMRDIRGRTLVISEKGSTPIKVGMDSGRRIVCGTLELYK